MWIKTHDIQDKLGVKNMSDVAIKEIKGIYNTKNLTEKQIEKYKRYGKKFIDNLTGIYIREHLALSIIMDCRIPTATEFRSKLGFDQHDLIMTNEQSVLAKIMKISTSQEILLKHSVLSYRIVLYFSEHKLAIEVDEKGKKREREMNKKKMKDKKQ